MIASPEGVERLRGIHPDVRLWTAAIDDHLDERRLHGPRPWRRRKSRLRHGITDAAKAPDKSAARRQGPQLLDD